MSPNCQSHLKEIRKGTTSQSHCLYDFFLDYYLFSRGLHIGSSSAADRITQLLEDSGLGLFAVKKLVAKVWVT